MKEYLRRNLHVHIQLYRRWKNIFDEFAPIIATHLAHQLKYLSLLRFMPSLGLTFYLDMGQYVNIISSCKRNKYSDLLPLPLVSNSIRIWVNV